MANVEDSYLSGANIDFIEGLYARFLEDPSSVDPSWRGVFERLARDGKPLVTNGKTADALRGRLASVPPPSAQSMSRQARVDQTIYAFRLRGHLLAQIDPLGRPRPSLEHIADVGMVNTRHSTETELAQWVD